MNVKDIIKNGISLLVVFVLFLENSLGYEEVEKMKLELEKLKILKEHEIQKLRIESEEKINLLKAENEKLKIKNEKIKIENENENKRIDADERKEKLKYENEKRRLELEAPIQFPTALKNERDHIIEMKRLEIEADKSKADAMLKVLNSELKMIDDKIQYYRKRIDDENPNFFGKIDLLYTVTGATTGGSVASVVMGAGAFATGGAVVVGGMAGLGLLELYKKLFKVETISQSLEQSLRKLEYWEMKQEKVFENIKCIEASKDLRSYNNPI